MKRHTEDGSSGSNASWVSTGAPLFLGEAAFLKRALRGQQIRCMINKDLRLGSRRDVVHSVLVLEKNLAGAIRNEMLDEGKEIDVDESGKKTEKRSVSQRPLASVFWGWWQACVLE